MKYLVDKLHDEGVIFRYKNYGAARQVVQSWIRKGRLILRKSDLNGYYIINDKEVEGIIDAFKKGGVGIYHTPEGVRRKNE